MTARDGIRAGTAAALGAALILALLVFASSAGAAVLHDQYDNFGADAGTASNNPAGPDNATELADDFTVPPGFTWTIDGFDVRGNDSPPPFFNVYVYANASGLPGTVVASRGGLPYTGAMKDRSIAIAPPISLGAGTYWIVAQAGDTNGWGWVGRTVQSGNPAAWRTEGAGPCMNVFMPLAATCSPGSPVDAAFRLNGTAVGPPPPTPPAVTPIAAPTATPVKKKCKKRKAKASAKKRCRKRRGK